MIINCDHEKTKMKLVARAIDYSDKHEQWFSLTKCCAKCGCVIKTK